MAKRSRNPEATTFARDHCAIANEFSRDVWQMVRNRRCLGDEFRREYTIGPYSVDFCCVTLKLIVEVDGEHHFREEGKRRDQTRDRYLRRLGYEVLRIPGYDVLKDPIGTSQLIEKAIEVRRGG